MNEEIKAAIEELKSQGMTVEIRTPQDMSWIVTNNEGDQFILTSQEILQLRYRGKLTSEGIRELDWFLKTAKGQCQFEI